MFRMRLHNVLVKLFMFFESDYQRFLESMRNRCKIKTRDRRCLLK